MKSVWGIHSEWESFKMKTSFLVEGGYQLYSDFSLHASCPVNTRQQYFFVCVCEKVYVVNVF